MANNRRRTQKKRTQRSKRQVKRIDVLPDDVLLEIFDCYVTVPPLGGKRETEAWQLLVHVCRRWRSLVLGSPRRLNLRLCCTRNTTVRDKLDIWPALPIVVLAGRASSSGTDNIIAALGQSNRVCKVDLFLAGWQSDDVTAAMQVPFPELTDLDVRTYGGRRRDESVVIPDSFLGGSAPRLRSFSLSEITFPGLPKLLLTAPHLVDLTISHTHHSWSISSEAMAALLSALSCLSTLLLDFEFIDYFPSGRGRETRRQLPSKRFVIPALTSFNFNGDSDYLENLVTLIDAPRLNFLSIAFYDQIDLQVRANTPRLAQFISRTPTLRGLDEAYVEFQFESATVGYRTLESSFDHILIEILCRERNLQLSSVQRVCNSLHPLRLSPIEDLYIEHQLGADWNNDSIESTLWLKLLLPFTAVKNLYLSEEFAPGVGGALQEYIGSRKTITELLPSLQNIFLEGFEPSGPLQENIGQFVAARQLSGHPIAISVWVSSRD